MFSRRSDATLVRDSTIIRRIMPYLMRQRVEATIFHEQILDLRQTLPFIQAWNARHTEPITVFHLVLAAICRTADERQGLARFVSGGQLYQSKQTHVSFAVKRQFKDYAPLRTVKFLAHPEESLELTVTRLHKAIAGERRDVALRPAEKEAKAFLRLPPAALSAAVGLARVLDGWGLLPQALTRDDPLFSTIFVANLGSLGIDRVKHHLYEYGTVGLFCALGKVDKSVVPGPDDVPIVIPTVRLNWTFDERINDAHYCVLGLQRVRDYVETPELMLSARDAAEVQDNIAADRQRALEAHGGEALN